MKLITAVENNKPIESKQPLSANEYTNASCKEVIPKKDLGYSGRKSLAKKDFFRDQANLGVMSHFSMPKNVASMWNAAIMAEPVSSKNGDELVINFTNDKSRSI